MRSAAVLLALSLILASFPAHSAITGSVFDEGGKPAAGIHVVAYQPEGNDDLIARLCSKSPRRPVVAEAVTDANGTYIIDVSGNGEIDLSVVEAGTIPVSIRHDLAEASAAPLALHRGNVIEGTVTDGKKPVADALVVARGYNASAETITGADGHYRLTEPARWAQMLIVMHPSFAPATLPPSQSRIVLEPGITATGRVTGPDGKGVAAKITVGRWPAGESGENGTFTIQHLPRRSKIIEASTPLLTGQTAISSSGSTTIALRPSASVSVIVRDTQSKPVQGLVVWLAADDAIRSAATDIHGAVEFRDLAQRKYEINAAGDSATFTIDGAEVDLRKVNAIKREITAKRQPAFSGIVHDDEGTPVAKATIYISPGDDAFPGYRADLRAAAARFPVAVTGAQGTFRFRAPSFGTDSFRIEAGKRGQPIGPAVAVKGGAEGRSGIALVIPKGIEVSGRVTSDGKAVESVRVSLGAARDIPISAGDSIWATTDTDGQFSGRLAAGATTLGFQRDNFFSKVTQIEVSEKTPRIEIALESAVTITGRVTNHDGSPAAGVMVMAQSASPAGEQPSVSDSDGTFSLQARRGTVNLQFRRESGAAAKKTVTAPATGVEVQLPATGKLRGKVRDQESGAPIAEFEVHVSTGDELSWSPGSVTHGDAGEFTLEDVPIGTVNLNISAEGYQKATRSGIRTTEPGDGEPIVISLSRGRTVRGRVTLPDGQPAAEASVQTQDSGDDLFGYATAGADGAYEIHGLPSKTFDLRIALSGYLAARRTVAAGSEDATLDVQLQRGLRVTGKVIDATGKPVGAASISASSAAHGAQYQSASSDENGAFTLDGLTPARYEIQATTANHANGEVRDVDVEHTKEIAITLKPVTHATIFGTVAGADGTWTMRMVSATRDDGDYGSAESMIDESGNYRIENAPTGSVSVSAQLVGSGGSRTSPPVVIDLAAGSEKRVDLGFAGLTVRGRVTSGGQPVAGAGITFSSDDGAGSVSSMTSENGMYEAAGLAPGHYRVDVRPTGSRSAPFEIAYEVRGSATFDIAMDLRTIHALVTDAETGIPIDRAAVSTAADETGTHTAERGKTDRSGAIAFDVATGPGAGTPQRLVVQKNGYATATTSLPADDSAVPVRMVRAEGAVVRIVDVRDGRTLTGTAVARDDAGRVLASANETGTDGKMTLAVAAGTYRFSASASEYGSQTVRAAVPGTEVRIALPRGGKIVLNAAPGVHGNARLILPSGEEYVRCWCSGIAEIKITGRVTAVDSVAPGGYDLEITLDGAKPRHYPISVIEGETTTVDLR